jgi:hypothetical protein
MNSSMSFIASRLARGVIAVISPSVFRLIRRSRLSMASGERRRGPSSCTA